LAKRKSLFSHPLAQLFIGEEDLFIFSSTNTPSIFLFSSLISIGKDEFFKNWLSSKKLKVQAAKCWARRKEI
jgi:hypothetical protein